MLTTTHSGNNFATKKLQNENPRLYKSLSNKSMNLHNRTSFLEPRMQNLLEVNPI